MRLSKRVVSLICLSSMMLSFNSSSVSNIEDNFNLSSMSVINKKVDTVVKSIKYENSDSEKLKEQSKLDKERKIKQRNLELEKLRKEKITYLRENITVTSGITEEELKSVLLTYNGASTMAHLSKALVDAENKYGVNAFAMAAIVALESGFATSRRAIEDNNLTGYEVYSDDSEGRLFDSQYESIIQTARHLSKNYLTKGSMYYNGVSVDSVQINYCPDEGKGKNWDGKVDSLANDFLKTYKKLYL
ncbi:glucosaminidase domain-containing protein [[Clostridium] dakarense]|uniref:glucosaminidase domain-containing protein n=1 Tax=Faecalimicrobium dakarense TaxID=1301100 RepID=UPI0004B02B88|nr:glucosaminidase domain-containing protein [[Clostridium] dakarense]